ncbi:alpha/beta-hydrolase [Fragilariopsis cylindrus CCMP1102]|uniref:Alpha/beta-hydrolase n=1 Tax=Fragilariopsis cylindrus CCMP1102 TaxID=635003 RepID=A0A1E7F3R1_9STRA|nr:alpha/beta-hydrolase [Fragilariopsis cylindrus CCMP1102]|eukprot:OEU12787.1 alpha/beta-hydrolase [Fragilariopsis cylindrus CCMP1102]
MMNIKIILSLSVASIAIKCGCVNGTDVVGRNVVRNDGSYQKTKMTAHEAAGSIVGESYRRGLQMEENTTATNTAAAVSIVIAPSVYVPDINATYIGKTVTSSEGVKVDAFLGIKFATQERFEASKVLLDPSDFEDDDSNGMFINATTYKPACAQPVSDGTATTEDCLYLDIYRPSNYSADEEPLPVMIWVYGGGFHSGASESFKPLKLVGNENVIVVVINYRLGVFGFVPTDTVNGTGGMNGIMDQLQAFKWIQERISSFGGDESIVTAFGESAGSMSICFLSVMESSKGLFRRAIMESRTCITDSTSTLSTVDGFKFLDKTLATLDCPSKPCDVNDLKSLTTEQLKNESLFLFPPVYDRNIFPVMPIELFKAGEIVPTDILIGANTYDSGIPYIPNASALDYNFSIVWDYTGINASEEIKNNVMTAYSPDLPMYNGSTFAAISQADGDINGLCFVRELAAIASTKMSGNVYTYLLGYLISGDPFVYSGYQNATRKETGFDDPNWTSHGLDIGFVFGGAADGTGPGMTGKPKEVSDEIIARWANFARSGNPQAPSSSSDPAAIWQPVVLDDSNSAKNNEASNVQFLYFSSDGVYMVEADESKREQCTTVLSTSQYFRSEPMSADPSSNTTEYAESTDERTTALPIGSDADANGIAENDTPSSGNVAELVISVRRAIVVTIVGVIFAW